jgi:hypothetical protein
MHIGYTGEKVFFWRRQSNGTVEEDVLQAARRASTVVKTGYLRSQRQVQ